MKNILLILSVCLLCCKAADKDKNADNLIGKWELEQVTLNEITINKNNMQAGIEENFRIDKKNWISKNHSFTLSDSLAILEKSRQSIHALMQMEYDIQKNNKVTLSIPTLVSQSGKYVYRSNKLFIDFDRPDNKGRVEFRVWLVSDTLHLFTANNKDEFIFIRIR